MSFKKAKKAFLRKLALTFIPPLGAFLIKTIYATSTKQFHLPSNIPQEPVIFAFWHGDLLLAPFIYYQFHKIPKVKVLISEHFDGQIIAAVIRYFQFGTIHGSSTRGGAKALINAIKSLRDGYDIGITPDGPKGPRHEVSDGIVVMAQKTKSKVIVFHSVPKAYWQLKSWDKFCIAKPFTSIDFYASEPIDVSDLALENAKDVIKKELMRYAI